MRSKTSCCDEACAAAPFTCLQLASCLLIALAHGALDVSREHAATRRLLQSSQSILSASDSSNISWSILAASNGGRVANVNSTSGGYLEVPSAALLGTALGQQQAASMQECLAACSRTPGCTSVNLCPANATGGCFMVSPGTWLQRRLLGPGAGNPTWPPPQSLSIASDPPGTCLLLNQSSVSSSSTMLALTWGQGISSAAGAPLPPALANASLPGYRALHGQVLYGQALYGQALYGQALYGQVLYGQASLPAAAAAAVLPLPLPLPLHRCPRPRPPLECAPAAAGQPRLPGAGSLRQDACMLVGTLEQLGEVCVAELRCDAIAVYHGIAGVDAGPGGYLGVLKSLAGVLDAGEPNWSPRGVLLVSESVPTIPASPGNNSSGGGYVPVLMASEGVLHATDNGTRRQDLVL